METTDILLLVLLGLLLVLAAGLGAAEASLLRVPRVRVAIAADAGDRAAKRLLPLVDDLPRVMNAILFVVLLTQVTAATITGVLAERHFDAIGITVASIVLTLIMFVYAEAIPKTYAVQHSLSVARRVSIPVAGLAGVLRPVVSLLVWFADVQTPGRGIVGRFNVTDEELRRLAAEAAAAGTIEESDAELVDRAFDLGDLTVREIEVPRTEITGVETGTSTREAVRLAVSAGHRRLPVYRESLDDILGVVRLSDLAAAMTTNPYEAVDTLMTPVIATPESKPVIDLLREMQEAAVHLAIVVDEHGGTDGIVTIEDVVAQLVGDVADEGRVPVKSVVELESERWSVGAGTSVTVLEELLDVRFPDGDWISVGGLVTGLAGRIPEPGSEITSSGFRFRVVKSDDKRVYQVEVERIR